MSAEGSAQGAEEGPEDRASFRRGLRVGVPIGVVVGLVGVSFGVVGVQAGLTPLQALVMSALVYAASGQIAAVTVVASGGGLLPAVLASGLMSSRFLAMGLALTPSLRGGRLSRAAQGQTVVDTSWAMSNNGDGTFDRWLLFGSSAPQYVLWVAGTALGAYGGGLLGDVDRYGLDAVFPVFFLSLLLGELRGNGSRVIAVAGAVVALVLIPLTPPGVPVLAASAVALVGLRRRAGGAA
jgi:4-azaleucine resistance transporter AzlC